MDRETRDRRQGSREVILPLGPGSSFKPFGMPRLVFSPRYIVAQISTASHSTYGDTISQTQYSPLEDLYSHTYSPAAMLRLYRIMAKVSLLTLGNELRYLVQCRLADFGVLAIISSSLRLSDAIWKMLPRGGRFDCWRLAGWSGGQSRPRTKSTDFKYYTKVALLGRAAPHLPKAATNLRRETLGSVRLRSRRDNA